MEVFTVASSGVRVVGRTRISRATDESTSLERQRELIEQWAAANDHTIVGWAEDPDVSGSVDPFDTPALGRWLKPPRLDEWDILCAWKLDRLARRAVPLHRLFGLCQDEGKTLVCVSDSIDLSTWVGRLVASVIAGVAEGELEAIKERTKASQAKLRQLGRWGGGKPVYGYQAVEREDGAGWELRPDPHTSAVVNRMVEKLLAGQSTQSIATELTEAGELTASDHLRKRAGKPIRGHAWSTNAVRTLLRSKTLLGYATHNGNTVRDQDGQPVMIATAGLLDLETFNAVQDALDGSSIKVTKRTAKASPLLGILVCPLCERLMHIRRVTKGDKVYRYYNCLGGKIGGGKPAEHAPHVLKADQVEKLLDDFMLEVLADEPELDRRWIPPSDNTAELAAAKAAIEELSAAYAAATSATAKAAILRQITAQDNRATALEATPAREGRYEYTPTGRTNGEVWRSMNQDEQREWALKTGIQFTVDSNYRPTFFSRLRPTSTDPDTDHVSG